MDDCTDPIDNMIRAVRYIQDRHPEWFDKGHSVWVDSSTQARRAKDNNMSKKINAGDTLTVGDLTRAYIGAEIEVGTLVNITHRFTLGGFNDDWHSQKELWTSKVRVGSFYPNAPVTIITPPPVVQPDKPTELGQCVRIEVDPYFFAVVVSPGTADPFLTATGFRSNWERILRYAQDRQIIVSDPPHWPDETPVVPERIEVDEWPDDDTHLREWEWIERDDYYPWWWNAQLGLWESEHMTSDIRRPLFGPWTRGNRVEV